MLKALLILGLVGVLIEGALFAAVCACAHIRREACPSDVIIVLGAQVRPTGEPSNILEYRLIAASELYARALAPVIIVCGAQGGDEPMPEAVIMRDYLMQKGVPEHAILLEDKSTSTITNLENAKAIMDERGFESAIIATSDYHMTRALYVARKLSIDASGASSHSPASPYGFFINRFRETLSWLKTFLLWNP